MVWNASVYVFIHKTSGHRYVGSSNLLRRRIETYFNFSNLYSNKSSSKLNSLYNPLLTGKFLPSLATEGLKAFDLIIFKLDPTKFSSEDALILEQYLLIKGEFYYNTLKKVFVGPSKGMNEWMHSFIQVFVYDLTCSVLFYHAKSKISLKRYLGIHTETVTKFIDTKKIYLNRFILLSFPICTANKSSMTVQTLYSIMNASRKKER